MTIYKWVTNLRKTWINWWRNITSDASIQDTNSHWKVYQYENMNEYMNMNHMFWSLQLPELNPTECKTLNRHVRQCTQPPTSKLKISVTNEGISFGRMVLHPFSRVQRFVQSMSKHTEAVLGANGGPTPYQDTFFFLSIVTSL